MALLLLLAATPVAAQNTADAESFLTAVVKRDGAEVQALLEKNPAVINNRNGKGKTALVTTILRKDETWSRVFLNNGADPNLAERDGDTPLIAAARVGFLDGVTLLLSKGAKIDGTNKMGETALIVAVQQRQLPMVELLLARGANPDKTDSAQGYSARDYAKRDTRAREILATIEKAAKKPEPVKSLDDFKLK